jgi:hypothetical protein
MPKNIAFCGLYCPDCPTFIATKNDDDQARIKTADMYAEKFGFDLKPEEINCDGCHSESGNLISYCQTCAIRKCAQDKGIDNCTDCAEQPCQKLIEFHVFSPEAKASFDAVLRGTL